MDVCAAKFEASSAFPLVFSCWELTQQDPLEAVCRDAVLLLRLCVALRVGAAGRSALRGAQVVHEGQPVLSTEVNEFDLSHA